MSSKDKTHVPRKVIRTLYVASQWSLKRKRYPEIRAADIAPPPEPPEGQRTFSTQWIVIEGQPVIAPGACMPLNIAPNYPTPERLVFLDTVLALAIRGGADEEITRILREDPGLAPIVPFLAASVRNANNWLSKEPDARTRIARLAGSGWLANPHIREEIAPYLPKIVQALYDLGASTPAEAREILGYAAAIRGITNHESKG